MTLPTGILIVVGLHLAIFEMPVSGFTMVLLSGFCMGAVGVGVVLIPRRRMGMRVVRRVHLLLHLHRACYVVGTVLRMFRRNVVVGLRKQEQSG